MITNYLEIMNELKREYREGRKNEYTKLIAKYISAQPSIAIRRFGDVEFIYSKDGVFISIGGFEYDVEELFENEIFLEAFDECFDSYFAEHDDDYTDEVVLKCIACGFQMYIQPEHSLDIEKSAENMYKKREV